MFGDVVRELAPRCGEAPEDSIGSASAWPSAGSAWPGDAAVWAGGSVENCGAESPGLGLGALSNCDLKDQIVELVAERARVEGRYLAALGELTSRIGSQAVAYHLRDLTRMNGPQARSEARLAESLVSEGFSSTIDAMQAGEIQVSHARVIAREAPKKHRRSEDDFLELSRLYPSDLIARHPFAYHSLEVEADLAAEAAAKDLSPLDAELALQRHERSASLRMGDDGMWHLRGKFDFLAGRQLSDALQAAVRSMRRRHNDNHTDDSGEPDGRSGQDAPSQAQFTADALCELALGTGPARRAATSLVIIADYDASILLELERARPQVLEVEKPVPAAEVNQFLTPPSQLVSDRVSAGHRISLAHLNMNGTGRSIVTALCSANPYNTVAWASPRPA